MRESNIADGGRDYNAGLGWYLRGVPVPRITYQNEAVIDVDTQTPILHASLQNGIPHTHVCGGNARCSTCRVLILDGLENCCPRNEREQKMAFQRLLAILFSDIRDFTAFSEAHLPYDVIHALNRYFRRVAAIVEQFHGQVDNFMGDGVMALFGVDDPANATLNAVRAGLEMLRAVEGMQPYFETQFKTRLRIGVGVHYGEAVLGAIGTGERRRLTAIGDAVNVANRVENANKAADTNFLISQLAYQQVSNQVRTGRSVQLPLKGKTGVFLLHEVTGLAPSLDPAATTVHGA